ncbi:MAG: hypothetical protein PHI41_06520 [Erysipelotrichaceae bacterium]|nr:hypothetical protein [Erysipelotrichaceae bacterium]MDD3810213.1 hypothetical protein [Erysipelotrichaceae bacterium]
MDAVNLNCAWLTVFTCQCSDVIKGIPVIEVDREQMKEKDIYLTAPMAITNKNSPDLKQVIESMIVEQADLMFKI